MRKAERLFQIITLLQGRRTALTAVQIAEQLEVSPRTIYRDIQALMLSGVPIEGEAGIGYLISNQYRLPPLMFDFDELQALLAGIRMVKAWTDPQLAEAGERAEHKIRSVLPVELKAKADLQPYRVYAKKAFAPQREKHGRIRQACEQQHKLFIHYQDAEGVPSKRIIWPLGLMYWGANWTVLSWCENRQDYRNFRIDRIEQLDNTGVRFETHDQCSLEHFVSQVSVSEEG